MTQLCLAVMMKMKRGGDDAADVQVPKPGEAHMTPEARVFQAVSGMLFNAQADVVEEQLRRSAIIKLIPNIDNLRWQHMD